MYILRFFFLNKECHVSDTVNFVEGNYVANRSRLSEDECRLSGITDNFYRWKYAYAEAVTRWQPSFG